MIIAVLRIFSPLLCKCCKWLMCIISFNPLNNPVTITWVIKLTPFFNFFHMRKLPPEGLGSFLKVIQLVGGEAKRQTLAI